MLQRPRPSTTQTTSWLHEGPAGPARAGQQGRAIAQLQNQARGSARDPGSRHPTSVPRRRQHQSFWLCLRRQRPARPASGFLFLLILRRLGPGSALTVAPTTALRARLRRPGRGRELGRSAVDHAVHSAVQAPHGGRIRGVAGRGSPLRHCEAGRRALREELERGADGACRSGRGRSARTPAAACCCGSLVRLDTALSARRASHVGG